MAWATQLRGELLEEYWSCHSSLVLSRWGKKEPHNSIMKSCNDLKELLDRVFCDLVLLQSCNMLFSIL